VWLSSPEIQTVNRTQNLAQYTYTWTVSNGVEANPINLAFIANRIGRYEITLTARSVEGCTAAVSKLVDVKNDFTVWVPNSFTPNDDGLNDQFRPVFSEYGLNSAGYRMEIFDRWGQSLFWTTDPQKGWNGQVKSELCKEGSYVYKIKYATLDGQVFDRIGYVLLLRN
jgi:gliding motility-associated-like protein